MGEERADEDLMLAYRRGDAAAFAVLFRRRKDSLYRYLLRQCGQPVLARQLFEDIWLRVIRARLRYRPQALFIPYLFRLAHQVLMDHYRRRPAGVPASYLQEPEIGIEPLPVQTQPDVLAVSRQQLEHLLQLLGALPEAQREVFLLREEAGLGLEEIARVIGAKPESARHRLRQAVQFLRKGMRAGA